MFALFGLSAITRLRIGCRGAATCDIEVGSGSFAFAASGQRHRDIVRVRVASSVGLDDSGKNDDVTSFHVDR